MNEQIFNIVKLSLELVIALLTIFVLPKVKTYIETNTTEKQRDNAYFWIKYAVIIAEDMFAEKHQGVSKKQFVLNWLNKEGVKLSEEQLSILIDMVVAEYNKNEWK